MLLIRAVRPPELVSIRQLGSFTNAPGIEVKYFSTSFEAARRFAVIANDRFGDGPYTLVITEIDAGLLPVYSRVTVDGGIEAVVIPSDLLYALRPPTILEGVMVEPDATAVVALLPTDQGGRRGPTPPDWFGCVLTTAGRNYDVRLMLDQSLEPGMTRRVNVVFLDRPAAFGMLPGLVFGLWEGREIGFGRIEQVHRANPIAA